jgi:hypothetical protein
MTSCTMCKISMQLVKPCIHPSCSMMQLIKDTDTMTLSNQFSWDLVQMLCCTWPPHLHNLQQFQHEDSTELFGGNCTGPIQCTISKFV